MLKMKKAIPQKAVPQEAQVKGFFDLVSPGVVKFNVDYYILGDSYRCAWAVREYPADHVGPGHPRPVWGARGSHPADLFPDGGGRRNSAR